MARLSEVNQGLYASFVRPVVRAATPPQAAEALRHLHPNRLRFSLFSDRNPFMAAVAPLAGSIRQNRLTVAAGNPLAEFEHGASEWIQFWLRSWGSARDTLVEQFFLSAYGSPVLQACTGLAADNAGARRHVERDVAREAAASAARAACEAAMDLGGVVEAFVRAVLYVAAPSRTCG